MTVIDWLWWSAGAVLALGGVTLLWRSLLSDRACGRPRCPRCWYEMEGAPSLRCPECGHETKRPRRLYRTRRHWRKAALATLLLLLSGGAFFGREVHRHGWIGATPTVAYIVALPWLEAPAFAELNDRISAGSLRQWEYRMLVRRSIALMRSQDDADLLIALAMILQRIEIGGRNVSEDQPWASWALVSEIDHHGAIEAMVGLLDHEDVQVQIAALRALGQFADKAIPAAPALLGLLAHEDSRIREGAMQAIHFLNHRGEGPSFPHNALQGRPLVEPVTLEFLSAMADAKSDRNAALAVLRNALSSEKAEVRAIALWGFAVMMGDDPAVREALIALRGDPDPIVRNMVVAASSCFPADDEILDILASALRDRSMRTLTAIGSLTRIGISARPLEGAVLDVLAAEHGLPLAFTAKCLVKIGGDPEAAIDALLAEIQNDGREKDIVIEGLAWLEVSSQRAADEIAPFLTSNDPRLQSAAAVAYVALRGADLEAATRAVMQAMLRAPTDGMVLGRCIRFMEQGRFSIEFMRQMLSSDDFVNRRQAAWLLTHAKGVGSELLPLLRAMRDDPDASVRPWAERAVKLIEFRLKDPETP